MGKKTKWWQEDKKSKHDGGGGMFYGLGFVGSLVYFLQAADSFTTVVLALPKAIIWPATIAYKLLEMFYGTA